MESQVNAFLSHLSRSQQQLARILEAQRHAAIRAAQIIHSLPSQETPRTTGTRRPEGQAEQVNKSITAYLNAMADFQQTAADNLQVVMKELGGTEEE
ncbi:nucleoside-diphosphate sugar epimerase [Paenibacillus cisolokensis]|uniref:nucleoside-diphosphate sugar epimerase n=1 Tax=Paenibacillus cisolokensis TaxID=1658519 RepID=UPI003D272E40